MTVEIPKCLPPPPKISLLSNDRPTIKSLSPLRRLLEEFGMDDISDVFARKIKQKREEEIQVIKNERIFTFKTKIRPQLRKKDIQLLKDPDNRIKIQRERALFHKRRKST